jgi:serine/threonine protein phosphatase 1
MPAFNLETKIQGPIAVIGDLHGQVDKLTVVLNRLRHFPGFEHRWVVFIGDLVDRGPDPKSAIDMVLELIDRHPRTTAIMGNHEFAMCSALGWLAAGEASHWSQRWVDYYNSDETFESYEATVGDIADLAEKVPDAHRELLVNLPWCVEHPHLLFVHAGLDPHLPFDLQLNILRQKDFTLNRPSWLCEKSFVNNDPPADCPFTLVSGHVKVNEAVIRPRRILVDTTGGDSGELSCVLMPERLVITSDPAERTPFRPEADRKSAAAAGTSSWWNIWG